MTSLTKEVPDLGLRTFKKIHGTKMLGHQVELKEEEGEEEEETLHGEIYAQVVKDRGRS